MKNLNLMLSLIFVIFGFLFYGCGSDPASSNEPGIVEGTIEDSQSGILLNNIQISDGENILATSDLSGEFSFQINKGSHDFHFNGNGYVTYVKNDVEVKAGKTVQLEIFLDKIDTEEVYTDVSTNGATWNNDRIWHINNDINILGPLTITEGTIIKFKDEAGWMVDGASGGRIIAEGTELEPIIFTSWHDDIPGGDSNGNQNATTPDRGDWKKIAINGAASSSIFDYCQILYAGSEDDCALLVDTGVNVMLSNCQIAMNKGDNGAIDISRAGTGTEVQNNLFYDNVWPLNINMKYSLDNTNSFSDPNNRSYGNDFDGILVNNLDLEGNIHWSENEIAFVLNKTDYLIPDNKSLSINPGVVLKMMEAVSWEVYGSLLVNGTSTAPVNITSYFDDEVWGDTNGDEDTTEPVAGDWNYIKINDADTDSEFEYCNFYYGGGHSTNDYTLRLGANTEVTVTNCEFVNNIGLNIPVLDAGEAGSGTVIQSNTFYLNQKPLLINGSFSIDETNNFIDTSTSYTYRNVFNAIFVVEDCIIEGNISWKEGQISFVMLSNLFINEGSSLTLEPYVTLKFLDSSLDYYGDNLINYNLADVNYTSWYDDTRGGDANGDESATLPSDGDWLGIRDKSTAPDTWEDWDNIHYAENP